MPEIREGRLIFHFPADWHVVKYDDPTGFSIRRFAVDGTKKVDILALSPEPRLHIIEIKDFRHHGIENLHRMQTGSRRPLHIEVAKKVRDTMAVLVAAYREGDPTLDPFCEHLLGSRAQPVEVVLFLEEDEDLAMTARGYRDRSNIELGIRTQLKPYGFRCRVLRRRTLPQDNIWQVTSLPADSREPRYMRRKRDAERDGEDPG